MQYTRSDFGADFKWGVSTAAYQIEGAHNLDGKGPSIWDHFSATKGKIFNNQNAHTSCNFYHRYPHDLSLMSGMNIPNYRFSLAWSRLFPQGTGAVNRKGVNFYHRVIDFCLEAGIEPWITLYHWDLPAELEKRGGWTNRDILHWFSDYVAFCIQTYGDRVKNWMILNEPMVFTGAGYFMGVHAPGRKGLSNFLAALHHAALCQAEGGRVARSVRSDLKIGTTFSCTYVEPWRSFSPADLMAATRVDALLNRTFMEPLLGLGYPVRDLKILQRLEPFIRDGDENRLSFDMDFIGIQNYTREIVTHSYLTPYMQAKIIKADARKVDRTVMNWEVYPGSIYHCLKKTALYSNVKEIIVTENGAAFPDQVVEGEVDDVQRKEYLQNYLGQVLKAKQEGVPVTGYFVWSFTDNFEWAEGYYPRFGLVWVDFTTQQRIIKSSGRWYGRFLGNMLEERELVMKEHTHR
ncbi:MAG: beta-glucosidase [Williamsia sp.]|nr:beta-glucosidase [Williamsia sp.]